jgi:RNA polymerase-binding transcription factor DksA
MTMTAIETRKAQLEARLAELAARIARIEGELEEPVSERFSEQATEREDDEVREDLGAAGAREVRMIEAALDRIANGSYGTCARCGDPIGEERLDALPATPLCADCASGRSPA